MEEPAEKRDACYRKFRETKQEPERLKAAIQGFFLEKNRFQGRGQEYGEYLKFRIRPVMERLIEDEAVKEMEELSQLGWFGEVQIEGFIQLARKKGKTASLMWLLHLKNQKYGYQDKDFSL